MYIQRSESTPCRAARLALCADPAAEGDNSAGRLFYRQHHGDARRLCSPCARWGADACLSERAAAGHQPQLLLSHAPCHSRPHRRLRPGRHLAAYEARGAKRRYRSEHDVCLPIGAVHRDRCRGALRQSPTQLQPHPSVLCLDDGPLPDVASRVARRDTYRDRVSRDIPPHMLRRDDSHCCCGSRQHRAAR